MARIRECGRESLPGELHPLWDAFTSGPDDFSNQARVLANSPDAFRHLYGLVAAWRDSGTLSRRIIEIAVVTVSRLNECPYCVGHHSAALVQTGLPAESAEKILEPQVPGLSEEELLVRDYARLVTERAWGIPESVFDRLRKHFDDRQILELTVRIGLCGLFNRLNQALEIEMEDGAADARHDMRAEAVAGREAGEAA